MATINSSRRALLKGKVRDEPALRPPWAAPETSFTQLCTRCGECQDVCETEIIRRGDGGFPEVDFSRGECTFCRACVDVCPESALDERFPSWEQTAHIGSECLGPKGVYCKSCGEVCEVGAIRFTFDNGRVPVPEVNTEACNGCGACVSLCPVEAITIKPESTETSTE